MIEITDTQRVAEIRNATFEEEFGHGGDWVRVIDMDGQIDFDVQVCSRQREVRKTYQIDENLDGQELHELFKQMAIEKILELKAIYCPTMDAPEQQ